MRAILLASLLASTIAFHASRACADEGDDVTRARFVTVQSVDNIEEAVCQIIGARQIRGRARAFDMRLGDARCTRAPMEDDALAVRIRVESRDDDRLDVFVEMDPSADVSAEEARATVADVGTELRARLDAKPRARHAAMTTHARTDGEGEQRANPGLYAFGLTSVIIGGVGVGGGLLIGVGSLIAGAFESAGCSVSNVFKSNAGSCNADVSGGLVAAGVLLGGGAAFLLTGAISMSIGGRKVVTAYATPTGGGIRVTF